MKRTRTLRPVVATLAVVLCMTGAPGQDQQPGRASLATFEGIVESIGSTPGEGGDAVQVAQIRIDGAVPRELEVALAPLETLRQIDFEVQIGDRLRVRAFLSDEEPLLAHKAMNISRGTLVRLRTLTRIPLWGGNGQWQGGPCRQRHGGHGGHGPRR